MRRKVFWRIGCFFLFFCVQGIRASDRACANNSRVWVRGVCLCQASSHSAVSLLNRLLGSIPNSAAYWCKWFLHNIHVVFWVEAFG